VNSSPTTAYVAPFVVLLAFLAVGSALSLPPRVTEAVGIAAVAVALWMWSRPVLDFRCRSGILSVALGVLIFVIWVTPDWISVDYRHSVVFENRITGMARSSLSGGAQQDVLVLSLRSFRAVALVPIAEELFWRGWLMRWLVRSDFSEVPLGTFSVLSFVLTSLLFATEHGPYWDVALITGVLMNAWMIRVKSLGDLIVVHATANACLSAYVILQQKWEYWL